LAYCNSVGLALLGERHAVYWHDSYECGGDDGQALSACNLPHKALAQRRRRTAYLKYAGILKQQLLSPSDLARLEQLDDTDLSKSRTTWSVGRKQVPLDRSPVSLIV
jgi:hypothetical protein